MTEQGDAYDWVIWCGEVRRGGNELTNTDVGEYVCGALGLGKLKMLGATIPCQYIQLGECRCAPLDMHPFDLEPPTTTCTSQADCPFLCSDALTRTMDRQLLCDAFPGIEWFQGENAFGKSAWYTENDPSWGGQPGIVLEINIYED